MKIKTKLFILLFSFTNILNAQSKLQLLLDTYKYKCSKSTTLVLVSKNEQQQFASINNFDTISNYDKNSSFYVGSVSKTFTAILILKLCEEKKISLNQPISKFTFIKKLNKNISRQITIQNLLQHSSGIRDFNLKILDKKYPMQDLNTLPLLNPNINYSEDYILSVLMDEIDFLPKTKCNYSNSNYYLLAKVIEEITDMPYSEAIREYLIKPLNLKNTYPYLSKNIKNLIHSYDDYGNDITKLNLLSLNKVCQGDGNIVSSLQDLNTLFNELFIRKSILSDSTIKKMLKFKKDEENGFEIGLGILKIIQLSVPYIGHQGDILSNQVAIFYNEESKVIFSLITTEPSEKIKNEILKLIISNCNETVKGK
jgi:D-alanyl-D-alanine carboxypeptidase